MIDMLGLGGHLIFLLHFIPAAENAGIYIAINALAGVDEFENIYKRRIEIDWSGAEVSLEGFGWSSELHDLPDCCRCWRVTEL